MVGRRARSELDKIARHDDIVIEAGRAIDRLGVEAFTMDAVAAGLGLAKGTLYRYFATREALVLAVLRVDLVEWFGHIDHQLAGTSAAGLDELLVRSLVDRPRMLQLLAVVPSTLERNVPFDLALDFKSFLLARTIHIGASIDRVLVAPEGSGAQLIVRLNACLIGLYLGGHPAPVVTQVLDRPEFAPLRVDLAQELGHVTRALVRAIPAKATT